MRTSLIRFRVMAWVVGVMLILLVLVAMPLKYLAGSPGLTELIALPHGFLYAIYLLCTLDLGTKSAWPFRRTVLVMLAGTIPFLSFVAERKVTRELSRMPVNDQVT
ncbi:DUF3817 domain-containing protein [soil metagenome]